ncbi:MAG: ATP-binding protein [Puniceicoccales bacterium]|nr:ATP-binding protein [Puniceicoccales bacterium]
MQALPVGIQTFSKLREDGQLYVDKTADIRRLLNSGRQFFLSRPRRFGKSLLVSTIAEIFSGNKALFEGLDIYDKWDWSRKHPVVILDWSSYSYSTLEELKELVAKSLQTIANEHQVAMPESPSECRLVDLIQALHEKTGERAVVLIDEYDKPIQDTVDDAERFAETKTFLRSLYDPLKSCGPHLRFLFLTGVSPLSGLSVFSTLNNLEDISFVDSFSTICGYTQAELESYFAEYITALSEKREITKENALALIKDWYNGYSWDGKISVYNPFSTLLHFKHLEFQNFWFTTATPTFLLKILRQKNKISAILGELVVATLNAQNEDPRKIDEAILLFQTGYLTIKEKRSLPSGEMRYTLGFPNREVRVSFLESLLNFYGEYSAVRTNSFYERLEKQLLAGDAAALTETLNEALAWIPYQIIVEAEGYYHTILLLWLRLLNFNIIGEVSTNIGRIDAVWELSDQIVVVEVKYAKADEDKPEKDKDDIGAKLDKLLSEAFGQIEERKYAERYKNTGKKLTLLAIACSGKTVKCAIR